MQISLVAQFDGAGADIILASGTIDVAAIIFDGIKVCSLLYTCTCTCTCTCTYVYTNVLLCVGLYIFIYVCLYVSVS